ncbi:GNAT family N-acetyltransferase [Actinopolyspora halophila]|uniref:GNAT family N-acetyltransferase n=1 Tax=Actinopolyspora halophila TaxID=1850 RepID=UPI00036975D1|nr:GNAT family N-acetyltransferase [Actinopolyspora halophila]
MNIRELGREELRKAYPVLRVLRPHLSSETAFREALAPQLDQGYRLICALAPDDEALAVLGFRLADRLSWGRHLHVDDLCTLPSARGNGYATLLLEWVEHEALRLGARQIHLDSGLERRSAHRLYASAGFTTPSLHFAKKLEENSHLGSG